MSMHTPGPWKADTLGGSSTIVVATTTDVGVAQIIQYIPHIDRANAHLIAAAPDLLAALQMVCDSGCPLADPIERAMLDALAKAEGRAQEAAEAQVRG